MYCELRIIFLRKKLSGEIIQWQFAYHCVFTVMNIVLVSVLTDIVKRSWTHISMTTGQQDTETECHPGEVGQWSMHINTPASWTAPQFKHTHKMLKICLILAALSSVVFSTQLEDIADVRKGAAREPKLFFVSSSSTTSTVTTFSNCYSTLASVTATCGRKRRAITDAIGEHMVSC